MIESDAFQAMRKALHVIRATFFTLTACIVFPANGLPGDEHWDSQFDIPGVSNVVFAIEWHKQQLYVGGYSGFGSAPVSPIHRWNGFHWTAMGAFSRTGGVLGIVYDLLSHGGYLYVGGDFSHVDGVPTGGLVRWDGSGWSSMNVEGVISALVAEGDNLYVGGWFTKVGGTVATNIARFDGISWYPLGGGLGTNTAINRVRAILATNGFVYAGGNFNASGRTAMTNIACWNGANWSAIGSGFNYDVQTLVMKDTELYAGGLFDRAGDVQVHGVARWDGTAWNPLGEVNCSVGSLAVFHDDVIVGGCFTNIGSSGSDYLSRWDGTQWQPLSADPVSGIVIRLKTTPTNLYVGGIFSAAGPKTVGHIAAWDGMTWQNFGETGRTKGLNSFPRAIRAAENGDIFVGGGFQSADKPLAKVARFDGTNWHNLSSGVVGTNNATTTVNALATHLNTLYAGGIFTNAGGIPASNIARWDGANWHAMGDGVPGTVSAIALQGGDVVVGGTFSMNLGSSTAVNLAKWNGNAWSALPGANLASLGNAFSVNALAVSGSDVYVGGRFVATSSTGQRSTNIARHSGGDWVSLAGGVNSNVNAIVLLGNDVYVGGRMTQAGSVPVRRIARWNGIGWSDVGGGVGEVGNFTVNDMAAMADRLIVGGTFTNAGGLPAKRIAAWDGFGWSSLGSGVERRISPMSGSVDVLGVSGMNLYVGGTFEFTGGKDANFFGRWNAMQNFDVFPTLRLFGGNVSGESFGFRVAAENVGRYVVEASTNMNSWQPLTTNTAAVLQFEDSITSQHSGRLYRARQIQ